jgi:hypothetical protein
MKKQTLSLKSTLILSAATLALFSAEKGYADSTVFKDKAPIEAKKTPVEAKAAEFKKVLQNVEASDTQTSAEVPPQVVEETPSQIFTYSEDSAKKPELTVEREVLETPTSVTVSEKQELTIPQETVAAEVAPQPLFEKAATEETPALTAKAAPIDVQEYSTAQNGRSPLGIIESNRDLNTQKWYLFSSAKRGIKNQADHVEIISIVGEDGAHRGEDVKNLLISMGIKPENIKVATAKGDESQVGKIYIFGK